MPNYQDNDQINDEFNTDLLLDQIFEEEEDIMYGISDYDYNHNQPQTNINHQYYPRQDKQHYIGLPFHIQGRQELIMSGTVHPQDPFALEMINGSSPIFLNSKEQYGSPPYLMLP